MTVNGISYNDDAARSGPSTARFDAAGFDPDTLIAGLSPAELLAVQTAAEKRLSTEATALLAAESDNGLLGLLDAREQTHRRAEVFDAALYIEISTSSIHRISDRGVYRRAGHISTHQLYAHGARLGVGEARRRRVTAEGIGAMGTLTGERLEPRLAATAAAVGDGDAGGAHVAAVTEIMDKLPSAVTHDQRVKAEGMLADAARRLDPAAVTVVGNRILAWLDPDGTLADDHDPSAPPYLQPAAAEPATDEQSPRATHPRAARQAGGGPAPMGHHRDEQPGRPRLPTRRGRPTRPRPGGPGGRRRAGHPHARAASARRPRSIVRLGPRTGRATRTHPDPLTSSRDRHRRGSGPAGRDRLDGDRHPYAGV